MAHHDEPSTESSDDDSWSDNDSSSASDGDGEATPQSADPSQDHTALYAGFGLVVVVLAVAAFFLLRSSSSTSSASLSAAASGSSASTGGGDSDGTGGGGDGSDSTSSGGGGKTSKTAAATNTATSPLTANSDSSASTPSSTSTSSDSSSSKATLPPNGKKAGLAGGDGFDSFKEHIGWWYDWNADTEGDHTADGVSYLTMLWGAGTVDGTDASRLSAFKALFSAPAYILGFNEPDLDSSDSGDVVSSGMDAKKAAELWEELIAPWGEKGSLLGSPAPAMQGGETWLGDFKDAITTDWDFTARHIYQSTVDGVQGVIYHYVSTYSKPVVITKWGCVDTSSGFTAITDQSLINSFVQDCVDLFEKDENVMGYAAIVQGSGLGDVWPLVDTSGAFSETGKTYLEAISKYG